MNSKDEIKRIDVFKNFNIVNDRFLVIKGNLSINDVYFELCNKKICEYILDDNSIDQLYKKYVIEWMMFLNIIMICKKK